MHGKIHLWHCVNLDLLRINGVKGENFLKIFLDFSHTEKYVYGHVQTRPYSQLLVKVSHIKFTTMCILANIISQLLHYLFILATSTQRKLFADKSFLMKGDEYFAKHVLH
jgi:hypothetical protein